jgi:hypothetical protein
VAEASVDVERLRRRYTAAAKRYAEDLARATENVLRALETGQAVGPRLTSIAASLDQRLAVLEALEG